MSEMEGGRLVLTGRNGLDGLISEPDGIMYLGGIYYRARLDTAVDYKAVSCTKAIDNSEQSALCERTVHHLYLC